VAKRSKSPETGRASATALDAAEYRVWGPRIEDLQRVRRASLEATACREELLTRMRLAGGYLPPHPDDLAETIPDFERQRAACRREWDAASPERRAIAMELREIERTKAAVFADVERRREEQDRSGALPFDDEAMEKFRALKADLIRFLDRIPSPDEYKQFFLERFVPGYNAIPSYDRYCVECGTRFALSDARSKEAKFCGDRCSSRHHNRGKHAERKRAKLEKHAATCIACKAGRNCAVLAAIEAGGSERRIQAKSRRLGRYE
jgi:hypothetical protein